MKRNFVITAKLWRWSGDMSAWHFIYVPKDMSIMLRENFPRSSMIKCCYTIGETTWNSSMFYSAREKVYLIPVKQKIRKIEGLMSGDEITITIQIL